MSLTQEERKLFGQSIRRCLRHENFLDIFYKIFMGHSEEIRRKFASTNLENQKILLKGALYIAEMMSDNSVSGGPGIEKLASVHNRNGRNIRPELYDDWLECMIQAVKGCDPNFDSEVERIWREGVQNCIEYMRARY